MLASRRVPGVGACVSWLVPGVGACVSWLVPGACLGVVVFWLVSCVGGLVAWLCVCGGVVVVVGGVGVFWWFRMLMCSGLFLVFLVLFLVLACCLVNNGLLWVWCVGLRVCGVFWLFVVCGFVFCLWGVGGWWWCERG